WANYPTRRGCYTGDGAFPATGPVRTAAPTGTVRPPYGGRRVARPAGRGARPAPAAAPTLPGVAGARSRLAQRVPARAAPRAPRPRAGRGGRPAAPRPGPGTPA